jgi:hypothetical protein
VLKRSPAQLYARLFGWGLLIAGILGVVGVLDVEGWRSALYVVSGLIGLTAARSASKARAYAVGFGLVYVVLGLLGEATVPHLLIGAAGLAAGFAPAGTPAPSTTAA